ncbi:MAG: ATP-binding protein [Armatimonadota bacterium]|nr:ATP-binding protein [Armatimonadota bacterium]
MRSRIGRRILAGYLAVSLLLAALLAASAFAGTWIAQVTRRVYQADRASLQVLTALGLLERRLFYVLRRALDPSASPEENRLLAYLLSSHLERLAQDPHRLLGGAGSEAARARALAFTCDRAAQAFLANGARMPDRLTPLLLCHEQLRLVLQRHLDQAQRQAVGGASRLKALEGAAWLPGFLRNLARNSERARRLSQALQVTLEFESRFYRRLSSALARAVDLRAPQAAAPAQSDLRLLEELEHLTAVPEARAMAAAVREAAARAEGHLSRLHGPGAVRAVAWEAQQVTSRLETLRPLLQVEQDRALADVGLVNASVVSFVQTFSAAAVVGLLGGFLVLLTLTRSMTASLEALREAMERVRDGRLDARVEVGRRRDETAEMARVFNQMAAELQDSRQRLQAYQADLQRLVAERTQALEQAQAQLVQAEKLSAVGELVAGVAHELNNPLTSVLGYAQLLESDPALPEDLRGYAGIVVREADRARQIIHSLLTFARPQPVEREVLDVNPVVRRALEAFRWDVGEVVLVPRFYPDPLWVRANAVQLQQVFTNIVQNALQAMGSGPGTLRVRTDRVGDCAVVEFADTGPGIPPEYLGRVFDPFFTTKKLGEGTGLGLSISYGIVRDHGGTIRAHNRPEGGACFTVELPLCEPPAPAP